MGLMNEASGAGQFVIPPFIAPPPDVRNVVVSGTAANAELRQRADDVWGQRKLTPYVSPANSCAALNRRKEPELRQHRLKPQAGPARARIVPPEFLYQLFVAVHKAQAALNAGL